MKSDGLVDADGIPARYQVDLRDGAKSEWMFLHQFGWYRRRIELLSHGIWDRSFFYCRQPNPLFPSNKKFDIAQRAERGLL